MGKTYVSQLGTKYLCCDIMLNRTQNICRDRALCCCDTNCCNMDNFVETKKMLKKKFRLRQEKLGRDKGCLMDELTWLQQGDSMMRHTSS